MPEILEKVEKMKGMIDVMKLTKALTCNCKLQRSQLENKKLSFDHARPERKLDKKIESDLALVFMIDCL